MGWEVGGRFKREGTYVHLWLKATQYCKAIILQLKVNKFFKKLIRDVRKNKCCMSSKYSKYVQVLSY